MNIAIIAAAGRGTRMDGRPAKQFLELAGIPIIIHTLGRFEQCDAIQEVVVVLPEPDVSDFHALIEKFGLQKPIRVVSGGKTRTESVWCGLQAAKAAAGDIVVVHDGVRPFVTSDEISRTIAAAEEFGAAILAAPVTDTIKETQQGLVIQTLDRSRLMRALTPQCFRYELVCRAFENARERRMEASDCSVLVERLGVSVKIVEGDARNIKITRPEDLAIGESLIRQETEVKRQNSEVRIQKSEDRNQKSE